MKTEIEYRAIEEIQEHGSAPAAIAAITLQIRSREYPSAIAVAFMRRVIAYLETMK